MSVNLDQGETLCTIQLEGEVDISSAAELKKLLLLAFQSGKEVRLDLASATELDITALQLLWAANREAKRLEMSFLVASSVPEAIAAAVSEAGFERFPVAVDQEAVGAVQVV